MLCFLCMCVFCKGKEYMGLSLSYLRGISFPALHYLWSLDLDLSRQESKKVLVYSQNTLNPLHTFNLIHIFMQHYLSSLIQSFIVTNCLMVSEITSEITSPLQLRQIPQCVSISLNILRPNVAIFSIYSFIYPRLPPDFLAPTESYQRAFRAIESGP